MAGHSRETGSRLPETNQVADNLDDTIRQNAQGPAKVAGDAGSVEQHPLPDQVAAARYLQSAEAVQRKHRGLRFGKFVPPGTV
ncbi:hypothetical protein [Thermopirellula anaerolimosa]